MVPMSEIDTYLAEIEMAMVSSPIIVEYRIIRSWAHTDAGYIRVRATLTNGDFLEAAEYFVLHGDQIVTIDYRHQWMNGDQKVLRRRWDSPPHHPELENFPHHVHVGSEDVVVPDQPMSLIELLSVLESALPQR
jgi:hypothetical protein